MRGLNPDMGLRGSVWRCIVYGVVWLYAVLRCIAVLLYNTCGTVRGCCIVGYTPYTAQILYSLLYTTEHQDRRRYDGDQGHMQACKGPFDS